MNILGIDYGLVNIGLAIAYDDLVSPYGNLKRKNDAVLLGKVLEISKREKINKIVIGLPEGKVVPLVKDFSQKISKIINIKVVLVNEDLSSQNAINTMIKLGKKRKDKKKLEHQIAACLILQNYLEGIS